MKIKHILIATAALSLSAVMVSAGSQAPKKRTLTTPVITSSTFTDAGVCVNWLEAPDAEFYVVDVTVTYSGLGSDGALEGCQDVVPVSQTVTVEEIVPISIIDLLGQVCVDLSTIVAPELTLCAGTGSMTLDTTVPADISVKAFSTQVSYSKGYSYSLPAAAEADYSAPTE